MSAIKDRAGRYRRIKNDETFREIMDGVRASQVSVFTDTGATIESIAEAHGVLRALQLVDSYIQSALDDEAVYDKKNA